MKTNNSTSSYKDFNVSSIVPKFPPEITSLNLIQKAILKLENSGKISRIPNAFIAYRMAFCKQLQKVRHPVFTQPQLSSMAKAAWNKEPEDVQKAYRYIAAEASEIYKQLCKDKYQINMDNEKESMNQFYVLGKEKNTNESSPSTNSSLHHTSSLDETNRITKNDKSSDQNQSEYENYLLNSNLLAFNSNLDKTSANGDQSLNSSLDIFPQLDSVTYFSNDTISLPYDYSDNSKSNFFSLSLHAPTENSKQCTCNKDDIINLESKIEALENKLEIITKMFMK
ncbi:8937_t:CDS:1 [Ambispora gerdemannii]|uniref:8937_t:CDS:1 n=1 Tax=Ambispora gerdemannii TaxID=144530 RepID=A0A9N8UZU1_9GLOM|nr:8937_t:CDS:1 [Ambispora gerdemannii]